MRHRNPTALWSVLLGLAAVAPLATEVRGEIYAKRATWQETMLATRANLAAQPKSAPVELSPWYTTGPLKVAGFSEVMFPEKGIDLQAKGPDGRPLWQQNPGLIDGAVQDLPSSGASDSTYLYRTLTVKQAMKLPAGFSSDDGLEVWLNGKKLISANVARTASPNADRAELDLKPGENRLLLKIFNINGEIGRAHV